MAAWRCPRLRGYGKLWISCCPSAGTWLPPRRFFKRAIGSNGVPDRVVIDKSGANLAGLQAVNAILKFTGGGRTVEIRQVKYLNNILEQDHRFMKRITSPMMGFKAFHSASATLAGIETAHMIRKGQIPANGTIAFQTFAALVA
ncbi:hypothetical protein TRIHO_23330 [Tritonibacter horizontis]|uniref:DDE domain-containing protein n=1 Tax=Tritonibacter horizontis TaxID=1768241 RepID=A0A132BXV5_9RHOB|nr:hypothetical protein TRIHO_23330 [Tritonibacter horizontis]